MSDRLLSYRTLLIGCLTFLALMGAGTGMFLLWKHGVFWQYLQPQSTVQYKDLDPNAPRYWALRAERDILAGKEGEGQISRHKMEAQLYRNLSSSILEARMITDPLQRAQALGLILQTQLKNDVGTNIADILNELDKSSVGRFIKNRYTPDLIWYYLREENTTSATTVLRSFSQSLRSGTVDLESQEQRRILSEVLDASAALNVRGETNLLFEEITQRAKQVRNIYKRDDLYAFLAEQQFRLREMKGGFETVLRIEQPLSQTEVFQKLLANRARFSNKSGSPSSVPAETTLSNPETVNTVIEGILSTIAKIQPEERQLQILTAMITSGPLTDREIRDLFQYRFALSSAFSSRVNEQILQQLLNPRVNKTQETPAYTVNRPTNSGRHPGGTIEGPAEWGSRNKNEDQKQQERDADFPTVTGTDSVVLRSPTSTRNQLYRQEANVLLNTAQDLLRWNKRKETVPLLVRAGELCESLFFEASQDTSLAMIASMIVATGDVDTAQTVLRRFFELILETGAHSSSASASPASKNISDPRLGQIAAIQLRGRLLEEALESIRNMSQGQERQEQFRDWVLEMLRIGEVEKGLNWIEEKFQDANDGDLREKGIAVFRNRDFSSIWGREESERLKFLHDQNRSSIRNDQLEDLVITQLRLGLVCEAAKNAELLDRSAKKESLLKQIVQEIGNTGRPYVSSQPFQQHVRRKLFHQGMTTTRHLADPYDQALAQESLFGQLSGMLDTKDIDPVFNDIVKTIRLISDRPGEKAALLVRLLQSHLNNHASEVRSNISGSWAVLADSLENGLVVTNTDLLQEAMTWLEQSSFTEDRVLAYARLSTLFFQMGDQQQGLNMSEKTMQDLAEMQEGNEKFRVLLNHAQTLQQADLTEQARELFDRTFEWIVNYINTKRLQRTGDPLLLTREKERLIADLARAQGELDLFEEAIQTTRRINEPVTEDRLFKTIGHVLLARGQFEDARKAFLLIDDKEWKQACLKEVLFRIQWKEVEQND